MPKMWKTNRVCDCASKRVDFFSATNPECKDNCYLHGLLSKEKIIFLKK
jgi:hypothetical protein